MRRNAPRKRSMANQIERVAEGGAEARCPESLEGPRHEEAQTPGRRTTLEYEMGESPSA